MNSTGNTSDTPESQIASVLDNGNARKASLHSALVQGRFVDVTSLTALLGFLAILLSSIPATAQVYRWVDADGNTHFGDAKNTPDYVKSTQVEFGKLNTITSVTSDNAVNVKDKVVMYSTAWCGYCKKARRYFKENDIAFTEYDIEKSQSAAVRHKKLGGSGVPLILYGDKRMSGFSEAGFERIYSEEK